MLGMSGEALAAYADSKIGETFEAERLVGGAWRIKTNAAWLPSGEMVMKPGEKYEMDLPGL